MSSLKSNKLNAYTTFYIIFTVYLFIIVQFKVGINSIFSIIALFIGLLFLFDDRYAFFAMVQLYLLRRNIIINDNYISSLYSIAVVSIILIRRALSRDRFTYSVPILLFLITIVCANLATIFLDANNNFGAGNGIMELLFQMAYFVITVNAVSNRYDGPLFSKRKDISVARTISAFGPLFTLLFFYVFNVPLLARASTVASIADAVTQSYTRIDPNFLSADLIILCFILLNGEKKKQTLFLMLYLVFNLLYLLSVTGFVLSAIMFFFLLSDTSSGYKKIIGEFSLIVCSVILAGILWNMKYVSLATSKESTSNFFDFLLTGRVETWRAYILSILENPFLGYGSSTWIYVGKYLGFPHYAHNSFLENMAGYGVIYSSVLYVLIGYSVIKIQDTKLRQLFVLWFLVSLVLSYSGSFLDIFSTVYIMSKASSPIRH